MSRRFQGLCLVSVEGWRTIDEYDKLPPQIRQRLRESPYNLCAACVYDGGKGCVPGMLAMIRDMEMIISRGTND